MREQFEYMGQNFQLEIGRDDYMQEPWKENDGHGVVSEWTSRDKAPGERVLASDRGRHIFYDVQATQAIALKDGWGLSPDDVAELKEKLGRTPTKREVVAAAVEWDYNRLRAWCNDEWYWASVIVRLGDKVASIGGCDGSDCNEYLMQLAHELADEILCEVAEEQARLMDRPTFAIGMEVAP